MYFIARYGTWSIGKAVGDTARGVDFKSVAICAEDIKGDVEEFTGSEWEKTESVEIKCTDDVICSCENLDISGLQYQRSRNGYYKADETYLNGRQKI